MSYRRRIFGGFGAVVAVLWIVTACSGSAAVSTPFPASTPRPAPAAATAAPAPGNGTPGGSTINDDGPVPSAGALIVRTGTLALEVTDIQPAVDQAHIVISNLGGYVSASDEKNDAQAHSASITYRMPVERWDEALNGLRALAARVISETTSADEVTAQAVDLDARITNLRASETQFQTIMTQATAINDILTVQSKLNDVRDQIERLVAQQQSLTNQAALGTLTANWTTPVVVVPQVTEVRQGWDIGVEIDRAAAQTVKFGQGVASVGVWLVVVGLPVFGPMLIIGFIAYRLRRRWLRKHPQKPNPPRWGPSAGPKTGATPGATRGGPAV